MDQTPLVADLIEAGSRFLEEFAKEYAIAVAFWMKERNERRWHLYIASPKLDDGRTRDAYGVVGRITDGMKGMHFDPFRVKLQMMNDPMVRFALEYRPVFPERGTMILDAPSYYGADVEGVYLYPPLKSAAA